MPHHAVAPEQSPKHPLDEILERVHTSRDLYQATVDKAAIPGHEFDLAGPRGKWASIGVGTHEDVPQLGRVRDGKIVAIREGRTMPGNALLVRYAQHNALEGGAAAAEEQLARLRVLAAGTYIEQNDTPDGPRVVAFGISGTEQVAPKTVQSLQALHAAGYVPAVTALGENPRVPGMINAAEVLLRYDIAPDAPYTGETVDTSDRDIDAATPRFSEWNAAAAYWAEKAAQAGTDVPPAGLGGTALRG